MNNVHFEEVIIINPEITSKEEIMRVCRKIASEKGLKALNMRTVAAECGIALGTLYNYYEDKETLVIAAVGSVWQDIFNLPEEDEAEPSLPFCDYVERLFCHVYSRFREYPDFITTHTAVPSGCDKSRAINAMERCTEQIRGSLLAVLKGDTAVRPGSFSGELSEKGFVEFVLDSIIMLLIQGKPCDTLIGIIRRLIY